MSHIVAVMGSSEIQTDNGAAAEERVTSDELVLALRGLSRALQEFLVTQARGSDLALTELTTLIRAAEGEGIHPADAARALGLRSSSMTALADRLEQRRLIRRVPHPTDRRLVYLKATPQGRKHLEQALGPLLGQVHGLADTLDQVQRGSAKQLVTDLTTLLTQYASETPIPRRPAAGNGRLVSR